MAWYASSGGRQLGPLTSQQLKDMASAGTITSDWQVRQDDGPWHPVTELKGLEFSDPPPIAPPAIAQPVRSVQESTVNHRISAWEAVWFGFFFAIGTTLAWLVIGAIIAIVCAAIGVSLGVN